MSSKIVYTLCTNCEAEITRKNLKVCPKCGEHLVYPDKPLVEESKEEKPKQAKKKETPLSQTKPAKPEPAPEESYQEPEDDEPDFDMETGEIFEKKPEADEDSMDDFGDDELDDIDFSEDITYGTQYQEPETEDDSFDDDDEENEEAEEWDEDNWDDDDPADDNENVGNDDFSDDEGDGEFDSEDWEDWEGEVADNSDSEESEEPEEEPDEEPTPPPKPAKRSSSKNSLIEAASTGIRKNKNVSNSKPVKLKKQKTLDETVKPIRTQKTEQTTQKAYNPNYDGYYDDVLPLINDAIYKVPKDIIFKAVFMIIAVLASIIYLIFNV